MGFLSISIAIISLISGFQYQKAAEAQSSRYSQLVFPFKNPKRYQFHYDISENSVTIEFQKTHSSELKAIHNYDETLIKRVLITDLGTSGSHLKLILKDENVRATVTDFNEPFRIVIDLFDRNYYEKRDPNTGVPSQHYATSTPTRSASTDYSNPRDYQKPTSRQTPIQPRTATSNKSHQLLQPKNPRIRNEHQLKASLGNIPPGIGQGWKKYPIYIYRILIYFILFSSQALMVF